MRPLHCVSLALLLLFPRGAAAQETQRYRQWMEGMETGGMEMILTKTPTLERMEHREWTQLERMGMTIRQEITETATKAQDGSVNLVWKVQLSSEPLLGEATWSPKEPGLLRVAVKGAAPSVVKVPAGALLWPGDSETRLRHAARNRIPVQLTEFTSSTQQWTQLDIEPIGPEPLPGFPDTVHFHGRIRMGMMSSEVDTWISPQQGEVKQTARMAGLMVLLQRAELPPPSAAPPGPGFFERTLAKLPRHPFLPWIRSTVIHWEGPGKQELPQDDQQVRLADNRYRVRTADTPSRETAAEMPIQGAPTPEDAPFLAQSPLLQFQEPVFNSLLARMNPPRNASRWELAKRVTSFVFEWISEKDMSVGFASAQEVARIPRGDCTEHGVLAVALLRKLGVPARGAVGWVGLGEVLGLHFWVEVKLGDRWVPVDPTFDQAPASALRLKLATTDLVDLGSIGWDTASLRFVDGAWVPEKPWTEAIHLEGDSVIAPGVATLRVPGGRWNLKEGRLLLSLASIHEFEAVTHPTAQQLAGARLMLGASSGRHGWWHPGNRMLWMDLGSGRWVRVDRMDESSAFKLLDLLETRF